MTTGYFLSVLKRDKSAMELLSKRMYKTEKMRITKINLGLISLKLWY